MQDQIAKLEHEILELRRQMALNQLELARLITELRERVALLERKSRDESTTR